MGDFTVPNAEQAQLFRECGIEPKGYAVILDNDRVLCALHLKSRNEIMICKNRREKQNGNS